MAPATTRPRPAPGAAAAVAETGPLRPRRNWGARILYGLAALCFVLWIVGYIWIARLACAFGSVNVTSCGIPSIGSLGREDFLFLVALSWSLILTLFCLGVVASRRGSAARR
ncbi:methionine synthase I [Roseovarius nubinhibens ISM]|uniref:Methionine synthase I n=1 Tax=Roseovarius nubinhibens (strain ATCC BAA-591 / DSM 15170 / ISM) TaxID=89187 RepID=A3SN36_ROSNI|nr:methionine synthase I [Roseovarius nubinhibens ISM]